MRGALKALGVIALLLMLNPLTVKAQALPQLPIETLNQLQLIQSDAQNLAMASEGLNVYDNSSANTLANIALFGSLYRTLQAWNSWVGGDDYQVTRAYVMERTQLPEWLANYAGDVIFWELDYFGHTIEMLTDEDGYILNRDDAEHDKVEPAVNCRIKHTMIEAVEKYKVENPDKNEAMVVENFIKPNVFYGTLKNPYLEGRDLHFFVVNGGTVHHYIIKNFTNCICAINNYGNGFMNMLVFRTDGSLTNVQVWKDGVQLSLSANTDPRLSYYGTHGNFKVGDFYSIQIYDNSLNNSFSLPCYQGALNLGSSSTRNIYANNCNGFQNNVPITDGTIGDIFLASKKIREVTNNQAITNIENTPISSSSLQEITDAISQIQPQTDPETGIEIMPLPQEFPLPESVPLEYEEPAPPIPPSIEDFPTSDPEVVPEYDPEVLPSTTPTEDSLPDSAEDIQPLEELQLVTGLQNRFPFSIPWDIYNAFRMLQAQKEAPVWEWTMNVNLWNGDTFSHTFTLSMEPVDSLVRLFRDLFLLAFILGLAVYSYNKFFGGGA